MPFKFEKLEVWKESIVLTGLVHEVTLTFPKEELYILTSQIKRAADSIALNLAEGSTGQSDAEFAKFLGHSIRSGVEVVSCIYVARQRKIILELDFKRIYEATDILVMRIQALRKSIKGK